MTLPRTLLALALVALAVNVAEAHAAAPWSAPVSIEGSPAAFPDLTFAPGTGTGLVGWSRGGALPDPGSIAGAAVTPGGTAGPSRVLTGGFLAARLRAYGANRLIAAGTRFSSVPRPYWALGRTSGALSARRPIAGNRRGYAPDLAVNARGRAVVALRLCESTRRCRRPVPAIAIRRAGRHGFSRPVVLGRGPVFAMAVAINARGDVLAVWDRPLRGATGRRGIHTAIVTAGGRRTIRRVGTSEPIPKLSAAIGARRSAIVGWLGQGVGEGSPRTPATIQVAAAEPGRRFGAAQRLEVVPRLGTGHYVGHAGVAVDVAADGRRIVAWTGYANGRFVVRAGHVEGGELREPAQTISDPVQDTVLGDLTTGEAGEAVAILLAGIRGADPSGPVRLRAATRTPGSPAFGTLEEVAAGSGYREAPRVEIVPTSGRVVTVWRDLEANAVRLASRPPLAPGAYALPGA